VILDTDVLIDLARKKPYALAWLANLSGAPSVGGIAALELLFGARDTLELRDESHLEGLRKRVGEGKVQRGVCGTVSQDERHSGRSGAVRICTSVADISFHSGIPSARRGGADVIAGTSRGSRGKALRK
jgi:hypothetical protein